MDSPAQPAECAIQNSSPCRYQRTHADDNHYAHPIDFVPIVDLNSRKVGAVPAVPFLALQSPPACSAL